MSGIHPILLPLLGLAAAFAAFIVTPWLFIPSAVFFALWAAGFARWMFTGR